MLLQFYNTFYPHEVAILSLAFPRKRSHDMRRLFAIFPFATCFCPSLSPPVPVCPSVRVAYPSSLSSSSSRWANAKRHFPQCTRFHWIQSERRGTNRATHGVSESEGGRDRSLILSLVFSKNRVCLEIACPRIWFYFHFKRAKCAK